MKEMEELEKNEENGTIEPEQIETENPIDSAVEEKEEFSGETIIKASDLSVILGGNLILSGINLSLNKGEMLYLIGKTGTGKSTFLRTVYADVKPSEGELEVAGFNLKKIKRKKIPLLRKQLGMVFQDFQLLTDRNVQENLLFVMKATGWKKKIEMLDKCNELLEIVGLKGKNNSMPHQLSGGEQQRVCIARALINKPQIILADEPTGNLDPETSNDIMRIFKDMNNEGISVLIATHNYKLIDTFPARTYQFKNGKIDEILSDNEINEITE